MSRLERIDYYFKIFTTLFYLLSVVTLMGGFSPHLASKSCLTTSFHHCLLLFGELTVQLAVIVLLLEVFLSCPIKREFCLLGQKRIKFVTSL